jgi:DNA adenine methylase
MNEMKVTAVANWFGGARMVADRIGTLLRGCSLVLVPFAGGMSELPYIEAAKLLVNDKHRHLINLARVMAHPTMGPKLYRSLRRLPFHPVALMAAQSRCSERGEAVETGAVSDLFGSTRAPATAPTAPDLEWAIDYAVSSWMGRGGNAGTRGEFNGALPIRYSPNGGGSGQRFHNWTASIPAWRRVLRRCEFSTDDALEMLAAAHDNPKCGIYCDPPWPDAGDGYRHTVDETFQRSLAERLRTFNEARVVVRFGDHPLIRALYPETVWTWQRYPSRSQHNKAVDEVLILNRAAMAAKVAA